MKSNIIQNLFGSLFCCNNSTVPKDDQNPNAAKLSKRKDNFASNLIQESHRSKTQTDRNKVKVTILGESDAKVILLQEDSKMVDNNAASFNIINQSRKQSAKDQKSLILVKQCTFQPNNSFQNHVPQQAEEDLLLPYSRDIKKQKDILDRFLDQQNQEEDGQADLQPDLCPQQNPNINHPQTALNQALLSVSSVSVSLVDNKLDVDFSLPNQLDPSPIDQKGAVRSVKQNGDIPCNIQNQSVNLSQKDKGQHVWLMNNNDANKPYQSFNPHSQPITNQQMLGQSDIVLAVVKQGTIDKKQKVLQVKNNLKINLF